MVGVCKKTMSCSCGDIYCDGYNCNNNGNGIALAILILIYPYLPFMVVGYEWMDKLSGGVNIFKWVGSAIGLALGLYFYFILFRKFVNNFLNIYNSFLYWLISYGLSSLMFVFLTPIYPENHIVRMVRDWGRLFSNWAMSVS